LEPEWFSLTHTFSHREWQMHIYLCQAMRIQEKTADGTRWMDRDELQKAIWAGPHRKVAARVDKDFGELLQEKGS